MYRYKNVSKDTLTLVSEGQIEPRVVEPDAIVESSVELFNPHLKAVEETKPTQPTNTQPAKPASQEENQ